LAQKYLLKSQLPRPEIGCKFKSMKPSRGRNLRRKKLAPKTKKISTLPRTASQYEALSEKSKDTLDRVLRVISKMRTEKLSLTKASQEVGANLSTVKRWAKSVLKKRSNGRFAAKASDQVVRVLKVPGDGGIRDIVVKGSRQATFLADFWNALERYLKTGDSSRLENFRGKSIKDAAGAEIPLPIGRAELNRIASAGLFSFESIYNRTV